MVNELRKISTHTVQKPKKTKTLQFQQKILPKKTNRQIQLETNPPLAQIKNQQHLITTTIQTAITTPHTIRIKLSITIRLLRIQFRELIISIITQ